LFSWKRTRIPHYKLISVDTYYCHSCFLRMSDRFLHSRLHLPSVLRALASLPNLNLFSKLSEVVTTNKSPTADKIDKYKLALAPNHLHSSLNYQVLGSVELRSHLKKFDLKKKYFQKNIYHKLLDLVQLSLRIPVTFYRIFLFDKN